MNTVNDAYINLISENSTWPGTGGKNISAKNAAISALIFLGYRANQNISPNLVNRFRSNPNIKAFKEWASWNNISDADLAMVLGPKRLGTTDAVAFVTKHIEAQMPTAK
jgi:hypothetical protein